MKVSPALKLEITAGISGAVVMILELTASRVLAPAIGTSLVAWTGIIGCIMAMLSLGYIIGGRLADGVKANVLGWLLLTAGLFLGLTVAITHPVLAALFSVPDLRLRSILATLILFGPATVALGTILPYCTGRAIQTLTHAGRTVARIYAISTIGSIVGTFLSGFYLISAFGNAKTLLLLSGTLSVLAAFWIPWKKSNFFQMFALLLTAAFALTLTQGTSILSWPGSVGDWDTVYGRYWIVDSTDRLSGRPTRYLRSSPYGSQSSMFLDRDDDLVATYLKFFRLALYFTPAANRTLMIGGGGYSFPKDFVRRNPDKQIDVVEIDSELTDIANTYFRLNDYPTLRIIDEDARLFLTSNTSRYDVIFIDAFDPQYTIPFHLTTIEMARAAYDRLNYDGSVLINIISSVTGPHSRFLAAEAETLARVFPQVYVFPVSFPDQPEKIQNVILVALKSTVRPDWSTDDRELGAYLSNRYTEPLERASILTDDHAPVEQLTSNFYGR